MTQRECIFVLKIILNEVHAKSVTITEIIMKVPTTNWDFLHSNQNDARTFMHQC